MGQPTREQLELIEVNYQVFQNAIAVLKEGNRVGDIQEAAFRDVPEHYRGRILGPGHGIGLNDDLYPHLRKADEMEVLLQNGMAISIEVATMVPGLGGVRYEDNFVVSGATPTRLSSAEKLVLIDA